LRVLILYAGSITRVAGTPERVLQIAKGLATLNIQVTLSAAKGRFSNAPEHLNLHVISMPDRIFKLFSVSKWAIQLVTDALINRYEIVQIESFPLYRTILLYMILRPFCRKFIIVFHDKWFKDNPAESIIGRLQLTLQRILLIVFNAAITPGASVKKFFEELHGDQLLKKMVVIPNGVPEIEIKNDINCSSLREKYGIDKTAFVALFFGSMTFKPNYEAALNLYNISNFISSEFKEKTGKKLIFAVAGIGSEVLPKTDQFIPLGFVKKLNELFNIPDVIVLPHTPSYSGPHVKTLYAFLSRKPVVATEDAIKDMPYVAQARHYLLFDINEPYTLLKALLDLYYNKKLRENLTISAYLYAKKFSWKYISYLHLKLYEKLLSKN